MRTPELGSRTVAFTIRTKDGIVVAARFASRSRSRPVLAFADPGLGAAS